MRPTLSTALACLALLAAGAPRQGAAESAADAAPGRGGPPLPVEELRLANGMRLLLLERPEAAMVAAGWVVRAGSADDPAGQSGMAHLLEHLLFQGTATIGARDPRREAELLAEEDRLAAALADTQAGGPAGAGRRLARRRGELETRLAAVRTAARAAAFPGELSLLYSEAGGMDLNANTLRDATLFYVTLPGERLETWFWLESDRLLDPVFREFDKERRVILEERRQRLDATPGAPEDARLRELFWGDHPYAWRPIGRAGELEAIERPAAVEFFRRRFVPANLTAALVGGFDPAAARRLAERYFGRLPAAEPTAGVSADRAPEAGATSEAGPVRPRARGQLDETCRCPEQLRLLYPTVPFGHPDEAALELLAGLLGGPSGRLHRSLVLDQGLAVATAAGSRTLRRGGSFSVILEARAGVSPETLLAAWGRELDDLARRPVGESELRRLRSRLAADRLRALREPVDLLRQLLIFDAMGGWQRLEELPREMLAIDAAGLQAAVQRYLAGAEPVVGIFRDSRRLGDA